MTAMSAAGSARSAGRCTSTPYPAAGRDPTRRRSPPSPAPSDRIPDGAVVLLDGLVASTAPEVLVSHTRRLRLVVLVHMPLGHRPAGHEIDDTRTRERAALSAASAIVTTSAWARRRLLELYPLPDDTVHVAEPAVDAADLATGTAAGGALLCVAAVTFDKGHDVLLDALATISELSWHCVCVGSLDRDPAFVERLRRRSREVGLDDRCASPDHAPEPLCTAATPPRT